MDLKHAAVSTWMVVFVLSSMLGVGLGLRVSETVAPLRNVRIDSSSNADLLGEPFRRYGDHKNS
jgi:hypothetical protein